MHRMRMILCGGMLCGSKFGMWHVIKKMCEAMQCFERGSAIFRLEQGVVQGSSLSPILFISERK